MKGKIIKNLFLFLVGFCIYITIEVCFRGYSYPVSGLLGGFTIVILDKINDQISWDMDLILQACCGSAIITSMELVIGEIALHTTLLPVTWDYSNMPFNFDGVICLTFSLIWILLSAVAIFLADAINYYVFEDTDVPHYQIFFGKVKIIFKRKKCDIN